MKISLYKIVLPISLIITTLFTGVGFADATAFNDVDSSNPYSPYILDLQAKGVTQGVGDNEFAPSETITRAEFVKLMVTAFHLPLDTDHFHFTDTNGHWAANYVQTAWDNGIIIGTSGDTFEPDTPIKREDAATIVWRYLKSHGDKPSVQNFMLPSTVDYWASEGVAQCIAKKLFGIPFKSGSFQDAMNRQEAAAIIDLALKEPLH